MGETSMLPGSTEVLEAVEAVGEGAARMAGYGWIWVPGREQRSLNRTALLYLGGGVILVDLVLIISALLSA